MALGDSISIDDYAGGSGGGGASLLAANRDDDFAEWRGKDLRTQRPGLPVHLLATDGGTSRSLLEDQLPRLQRLGAEPSVVTVTVGGNDVLSCYGDTRAAVDAIRAVADRLDAALAAVAALAAPAAVVVVGTVYDPSDGTGDAAQVGLPPWPEVVDVLAQLNAALRAMALRHSARVADIHGGFVGHGLAAGNPAQGSPRPANRDLGYCNVIEPNAWGANGVRAAFWKALEA